MMSFIRQPRLSIAYSHGAEVSPLYQAGMLDRLMKAFEADIVAPTHYGDNDHCKIPEFSYGSIIYRVREMMDGMDAREGLFGEVPLPRILMGYSRGGATIAGCMGARERNDAHESPTRRLKKDVGLTEEDREAIKKSYFHNQDITPLTPEGAILFAPGLGNNFERESLMRIHVPTLVFAFMGDRVAENIHETYGMMGNVRIIDLPGNHWTCLDIGASKEGGVVRDPPGVNRNEVHKKMWTAMIQFIGECLGQEKGAIKAPSQHSMESFFKH